MKDIFYNIYQLTSRYKIYAIILFFLLVGGTAYKAFQIELEEDIFNVIPKDEQVVQVNRALEGFKMNNRLILHLYFQDTTKTAPDSLIHIASDFSDSLQTNYKEYISDVIREFDDSRLMDLYGFFLQNIPFYLTDEDYSKLEDRFTEDGIKSTVDATYKNLISPLSMVSRKLVVQDPFGMAGLPLNRLGEMQLDENMQLYQNHLVSKDQKHLIFFITLVYPNSDTDKNSQLISGLENQISRFENKHAGLKIEYFGSAAVAAANASRIKNDIILTVSIALTFLFIFISFFYRDITVFFIAVTPGIFGAIIAIAFLSIFKGSSSAISLGVGSVLLGITIDYALHFITHFKHQKDIRQLFRDLTTPILMSALTTSCAFFSLMFLRSNALADLGLFAGLSVLSAALFTLIVLPHLVFLKKERIREHEKQNLVEKAVASFSSFPFYKSKIALGAFAVLTILSLFTWRDYSFESNMLRLNYMPDKLKTYEENLNQISTYSANNLYLISSGKNIWEALNNEGRASEKLDSLAKEDVIYNYTTVNTVVPSKELQDQRLERWDEFWEDKNQDSILNTFYSEAGKRGFRKEAFSKLEETLKTDYAYLDTQDIDNIFNVVGEDMIIESDDNVSVISSAKMSTDIKPTVIEVFEGMPGTIIFDQGYMTSRLITLLQEDFNKLVNISLVVVFLIILLSYGRIELAVIAFLPILISWLWILGLMGLFGLTFNIINIIICTFIFGLGIDYSIFVMRGLTQNYKFGLKNINSYKKSIVLSAVTTLAGIGVLAFAQHPALKSIALLAIIGIISVIFLTFTIQPIMYNLLIQNRKDKGRIPYTIGNIVMTLFAFSNFIFGCVLLLVIRVFMYLPFAGTKKKKRFYHWCIMMMCRFIVYIMVNVRKKIIDIHNIDFSKPSVVISNHHSFIDILYVLMFNPKMVMVTNDWVYYSPLFGKAVQYADFIYTGKGVENQDRDIQQLIDDGYSIMVFPEGTRAESFELGRFHKGAFYLAEQFKLDIQPIVLHGTNYAMPKKDPFLLRNSQITAKFLPRISHSDKTFGETYKERTKKISRYFKSEYQKLREELETPKFFKDELLKNYIYKGPVLEWYVRIKIKLEEYYKTLHELIPENSRIVDLGCGYGYVSYGLAFSSKGRTILGVDYDKEKVGVARNCPHKPDNLTFDHGDVVTYDYSETDVFLVSDVLHYLMPEQQDKLLANLAQNLSEGGSILIREGDASKDQRHKGTVMTEIFSTKSGFNMTQNDLNFISREKVESFANEYNLELSTIDNTKLTSNTLFILKKN